MAKGDSFDKIVDSYFSVVTKQAFTYKGKMYMPKPLMVSPLLFRGFECPEKCGACCLKFSLDYLPTSILPYEMPPRKIIFNGRRVLLYSDLQKENTGHQCKHLKKDGRCGIHKKHPFSCDFELIRTLSFASTTHPNLITQKLYGRGWNMLRIDGERGALCTMTAPDLESISEVIRKLKMLENWCNHFKLQNKCSDIIKWVEEVTPFVLKNYPIKSIEI